jgi:hypothetical protein
VIVAVLSDQKVKKMSAKSGASANNFPIVCVGGSAGGLDAYIRLLDNLPADLGVAIVVVNHIRSFPTLLHEILPLHTTMPPVGRSNSPRCGRVKIPHPVNGIVLCITMFAKCVRPPINMGWQSNQK